MCDIDLEHISLPYVTFECLHPSIIVAQYAPSGFREEEL